MASCATCKTETKTYDCGVPICIACADRRESNRRALEADKRVRVTLVKDLVDSHARINWALDVFGAVANNIPSSHPDGTRRIRNASSELTAARKEMMKAHSRLNDFLTEGIVPEDLKRSG